MKLHVPAGYKIESSPSPQNVDLGAVKYQISSGAQGDARGRVVLAVGGHVAGGRDHVRLMLAGDLAEGVVVAHIPFIAHMPADIERWRVGRRTAEAKYQVHSGKRALVLVELLSIWLALERIAVYCQQCLSTSDLNSASC